MEEKELQSLTEDEFIEQYKKTEKDKYEKPSIATDMVIFTIQEGIPDNPRRKADMNLKVLLIKRGSHPFKGDWALAGGFMEIDEDLDTTVQRELQEETGVDNVYAEQLYTWSRVDRDPRMRILSASYLALVDNEKLAPLKAGDDAEDAKWFTIKDTVIANNVETKGSVVEWTQVIKIELESGDIILTAEVEKITLTEKTNRKVETKVLNSNGIAFDHVEIILYSLERLRGKVSYSNIAFNLVTDKFTLPDLQQVYEVILGRSIAKAHFRRKIEPMVVETGEEVTTGSYRPSKLYEYNMEWEYDNFSS